MQKSSLIFFAIILSSSAMPASATSTFNNLSSWQSAVSSYNRDTSYGTENSDIASLGLDDGTTLSFGSPVNIRTIGTSWSTWSGGYTGQVLYTNGASSLNIGLSPVNAFGFFVESNPFGSYTFLLTLSDLSTVSGTYSGQAGAGFLGFVGPGITSLSVSSSTDFAVGDFYTSLSSTAPAVPEPATWAMMLVGFGAMGAMLRRKRPIRTTVSYLA